MVFEMPNERNNRIILVNDKIYGPSVGIFVRSITEWIGSDKNLYTYIYDKKNLKIKIEGNKIMGIYPPLSSGWYLNTKFQELIFRSFRKKLKAFSANSLIHYTSQQVQPFHFGNSTVTVHDLVPILFPDQTSNTIVKMTRKNLDFYRKLPVTSTISEFTKKSMEDYGFNGRIHVVPNTISKTFRPLNIDKSTLRKKLNLPLDKKLVLSVSANYPRKNLNIIEDTVNELGKSYTLVRVGHPLDNSINFSNVSEKMLNEIYNACDVFFMPSSYEGFGLPVLEAMSSGIPVVCSDIEIFQEVTKHSAFLSPIEKSRFKEGIKEVISNADHFRKLGLEQAKNFSIDNFQNKIRAFYNDAFETYGI